ncbi:hypothetical protein AB3480_00610 [Rhizobium mongolense]|uniref:hypothetical protein n=1 Tax=Rhizobium mongolense TaxID=57676 RepID=UPI0034A53009
MNIAYALLALMPVLAAGTLITNGALCAYQHRKLDASASLARHIAMNGDRS